jgi:very-short-patch-repair endonuclease
VTRQQLLAAGLGEKAIDYRVNHGRLYRVHPGVYSVGLPPITPLEHAMAAVLACGPGAVLSHGSALSLWGIWKRWDRPFHVTVKTDRRPKGITAHRTTKLDRRDITRHYGIPVTTLAKTLLDQAPRMTPKSLTRAINDGRLSHHLNRDALFDVLHRHPHHRGAKKLRTVLGLTTDRPTRSNFEDAFPAFCRRHGLPEPQLNTSVCGYEVDVYFPDERVIVELDSWDFHRSKMSFEADRNRDADTLAAGLITIRITGERFEQTPEQEASRLHRILSQRRPNAA